MFSLFFFLSKTAIYLSLGLHKVYIFVQVIEEAFRSQKRHPTLQNMNFYKFLSTFVGHFCLPGSGSGSATLRRRDHFLNLMLATCTNMVSRDWDISSGIGPCFPLAGEQCKLYVNAGGKWPIQRQQQQANPLLSMPNYTPLEISGKDKNKQLTLLSQCKLAFTAIKTPFALSSKSLKNKIKTSRVPYLRLVL